MGRCAVVAGVALLEAAATPSSGTQTKFFHNCCTPEAPGRTKGCRSVAVWTGEPLHALTKVCPMASTRCRQRFVVRRRAGRRLVVPSDDRTMLPCKDHAGRHHSGVADVASTVEPFPAGTEPHPDLSDRQRWHCVRGQDCSRVHRPKVACRGCVSAVHSNDNSAFMTHPGDLTWITRREG